jgi:hypothetical protein
VKSAASENAGVMVRLIREGELLDAVLGPPGHLGAEGAVGAEGAAARAALARLDAPARVQALMGYRPLPAEDGGAASSVLSRRAAPFVWQKDRF